MIPFGPATRVFLAVGVTDLRLGFEGLTGLVRHQFKEDPLSGHLFLFTNRHHNRVKLLYWDGSGFWVCAKRLARGCYHWPRPESPPENGSLQILSEELALLLGGIDLEKTKSRDWWRKTG